MRKVVTTGIVLSALLAWSAVSVGQNTAPQQRSIHATQQVAQATGNAAAGQSAAAGQTVETGTVISGGVLGTGLGLTEFTILSLVALTTLYAVSNTDNTTPSSATTTTR